MAKSLSHSPYASEQPQDTSYSPYFHTILSRPTFCSPFDTFDTGTGESQPSIDLGLKTEGSQPWMKTLASSMPQPPRQCKTRCANAADVTERSTDSVSTTGSSTRSDAWVFGKPTSDFYGRQPATSNPQVRPEAQQHETQPLSCNPLFGIPKDGQIRENDSVSCNYGENTRTTDNGRAQKPVDREQTEEPPFELPPFSDEVETSSTYAQTFQQCVLVKVRELCTDAARRYWQTKRPRPHLVIDIPSSRATRRSVPYPERQRSDIPPTRHFHDTRRVLHWTRDEGQRGLVYQDNLEKLIWQISEQEWAQASEKSRNWGGAGAHTERLTAVHRMNRLYNWAQTVIQAFERVHFDEELLSLTEMTDVMLAARDLAVWLLADDEKNEVQKMWAHVIQLE